MMRSRSRERSVHGSMGPVFDYCPLDVEDYPSGEAHAPNTTYPSGHFCRHRNGEEKKHDANNKIFSYSYSVSRLINQVAMFTGASI